MHNFTQVWLGVGVVIGFTITGAATAGWIVKIIIEKIHRNVEARAKTEIDAWEQYF